MRKILSCILAAAMLLSLLVVTGAAETDTSGKVILKIQLTSDLKQAVEADATELTYKVYLQPQDETAIGAAQFKLTSPENTTFADFDVNPALVYTQKADVPYGSKNGIFELDQVGASADGHFGGAITDGGKTLVALLAGTAKNSRMMTSAHSDVYVYDITLSVPVGVKANVDYTLTVSEVTVGYDDGSNSVAVQYRHTVTVDNQQVKYVPDTTFRKGDINGDGVINAEDLTALARIVGKLDTPDSAVRARADVTGDNVVNAEDLTKLAQYVGKLIPSLD